MAYDIEGQLTCSRVEQWKDFKYLENSESYDMRAATEVVRDLMGIILLG